ncbi:MAG: hypothetical protein IJH77_05500 [Mogibacterium sp.]|nr:hypothetical protein [Mogibacterium sp.]
MTEHRAQLMKLIGSLLIVIPMLFDHFVAEIPTAVMLPIAIIAAAILATAIVWLKIQEVRGYSRMK